MTTSGERFEEVLARLYTDDAYRAAFLRDPLTFARREGLDSADCAALAAIDRDGLTLAAESYARKRQLKAAPAPSAAPRSRVSLWARWMVWMAPKPSRAPP